MRLVNRADGLNTHPVAKARGDSRRPFGELGARPLKAMVAMPELAGWVAFRGTQGKMPPTGFPRNNKFTD